MAPMRVIERGFYDPTTSADIENSNVTTIPSYNRSYIFSGEGLFRVLPQVSGFAGRRRGCARPVYLMNEKKWAAQDSEGSHVRIAILLLKTLKAPDIYFDRPTPAENTEEITYSAQSEEIVRLIGPASSFMHRHPDPSLCDWIRRADCGAKAERHRQQTHGHPHRAGQGPARPGYPMTPVVLQVFAQYWRQCKSKVLPVSQPSKRK